MKKAETMKKRIVTPILMVLSLALVGCDKTNGCKTSHWPDPGITVSWSECNDVESVQKYFNCHDSALYRHRYDEIEIVGFVKKYGSFLAIRSDSVLTSNNYIPIYPLDGGYWPTEYDSTHLVKIRGRVAWEQETDVPCCNNTMVINLVRMEEL